MARLLIPVEPPSMDALDGHRWARTRWRERFEKAIPPAVGVQRAVIRRGCAVRQVIVTRLIAPRRRLYDEANLVGGCRPLMDALVRCGWLTDDAPRWMLATYGQERVVGSSLLCSPTELGASGGVLVNVYGRFVDGVEERHPKADGLA